MAMVGEPIEVVEVELAPEEAPERNPQPSDAPAEPEQVPA